MLVEGSEEGVTKNRELPSSCTKFEYFSLVPLGGLVFPWRYWSKFLCQTRLGRFRGWEGGSAYMLGLAVKWR